jgi:recombination protein RecR
VKPWIDLVSAILRLPGVGPKMAERIALHLLRHEPEAEALVRAVEDARARLQRCRECGDYVEADPGAPALCARCQDPARDPRQLCVVEDIGDLQAVERSRAFHGRYHVLGGALSALDGIGPDELRIEPLLERVRRQQVGEVIIATNPTAEGETTATYLADLLRPNGVRVTRLAYGLSSGSAIQYADEFTLAKALEGRRSVS